MSSARPLALVASLSAAVAASAAIAQVEPLPSREEARAILEQACGDDGSEAAECACLGEFVEANFSDREIAGAALMFGDPLYASDPGAGMAALLDAGFQLEEITAVLERIIALERDAEAACRIGDPPAVEAD